eukprot:g15315.t1
MVRTGDKQGPKRTIRNGTRVLVRDLPEKTLGHARRKERSSWMIGPERPWTMQFEFKKRVWLTSSLVPLNINNGFLVTGQRIHEAVLFWSGLLGLTLFVQWVERGFVAAKVERGW